jgi:hypothetical protein
MDMKLLLMGIVLAAILLIILIFIVVRYVVKRNNNTPDLKWLQQHGRHVIAHVVDVKTEQGWRYEDRSQWNTWEGRYEQARTWRTFYDITAAWIEPQMKQNYTFSFKLWADEVVSKPDTSSSVPIVFDAKNPERYYVDLKVL